MHGMLVIATMLTAIYSCEGTIVKATAPLEEVEEGAILSLHCQVQDIQPDLEITLFRTLGDKTERVSVNDVVTLNEEGDDERIFLAVRQLDDGTLVHFLSITDVTRADSGIYACSLYDTGSGRPREISYDPVNIGVMYFPTEEDPKCSFSTSSSDKTGVEVILNCSSEKGYPEVSLAWSTGSDSKLGGAIETRGNRLHATLKLRPTSNTVYLCTVTSIAFPGKKQTCHIGPLTINSGDSGNLGETVNNPIALPPSGGHIGQPSAPTLSSEQIEHLGDSDTDCSEVCSTQQQSSSMWMITTAATASVAISFLILVLLLLCRYYKLNTSNDTFYVSHHTKQPTEQMYSELEYKRNQNMVYMALAKREKLEAQFRTELPEEEIDAINENFRLPQISS